MEFIVTLVSKMVVVVSVSNVDVSIFSGVTGVVLTTSIDVFRGGRVLKLGICRPSLTHS